MKKNSLKFENIVDKLIKNPLKESRFFDFLELIDDEVSGNNSLDFEVILSNGLPLVYKNGYIDLETKTVLFKNQEFVFVDIETNGSDPTKNNIIEIGALKVKNNQVIDSCKSLIFDKDILPYVSKVTGITQDMLQNSPQQKDIMERFKNFLGDSVFVAHDVKFDYNYISNIFTRYDLGKLYNRRLCTIDLAKKTIEAQKYGLSYLNDTLKINSTNLHRAYNDAYTSYEIFKYSLKNIPYKIKTTEDLIRFSKHGK